MDIFSWSCHFSTTSHVGPLFFVNTALETDTIKTWLMAFETESFLLPFHSMVSHDPFSLCSNINDLRKRPKKIIKSILFLCPCQTQYVKLLSSWIKGVKTLGPHTRTYQLEGRKPKFTALDDDTNVSARQFLTTKSTVFSSSEGLEKPDKTFQHVRNSPLGSQASSHSRITVGRTSLNYLEPFLYPALLIHLSQGEEVQASSSLSGVVPMWVFSLFGLAFFQPFFYTVQPCYSSNKIPTSETLSLLC